MLTSPNQGRKRILMTHYETLNLQLHVIRSFVATREGACGVCGLPGHLGGLMRVPGVPGRFCCIECVECHLFGPGKCRWCGFRLDPSQSSFCSEQCQLRNQSTPFGSGERFALWLSRHEPRLFADLVGREVPTGIACLQCGNCLTGKRRNSLYCSPHCRRRFRRSPYNLRVVGISAYRNLEGPSRHASTSAQRTQIAACPETPAFGVQYAMINRKVVTGST